MLNEEDKHAARLAYTGVALHALLSQHNILSSDTGPVAKLAVELADAVVAQLEKTTP